MTSQEKRLEAYRRYNASSKGRARDARYEAKHPERGERWRPLARRREAAIGNPDQVEETR